MDIGIPHIVETASGLQRKLTETLIEEYDHIIHGRFEELARLLTSRKQIERELAQANTRLARMKQDGLSPEQDREIAPHIEEYRTELERTQAVAIELGNRMAAEKQLVASQLRKLTVGQKAVRSYAYQQ